MKIAHCLSSCATACALLGSAECMAAAAPVPTNKTALNAVSVEADSSALRNAEAMSPLVTTPTVASPNTSKAALNTNIQVSNAVPPPVLPQQENAVGTNVPNTVSNALAPADASASTPVSTLPGITSPAGTAPNTPTDAIATASTTTANQPLHLEQVEPFQPWQAGTAITLFLAAIGLVGYSMVRVRNHKGTKNPRPEKPMEIISSMNIGPKRQLLIVRVRNQEIVIASTEAGVTMLSEVAKETQQQRPMVADMRPLTQLARASVAAPQQSDTDSMSTPNYASNIRAAEEATTTRKSDLLTKALNNLKEKKAAVKNSETEKSARQSGPTPTLSSNPAGFNKFFANAFEQEAKRNLNSQRSDNDGNADDSVENVSKLIREKLKNIQAAGN
jgi:flagellar biogenesis protein FliO